MAGSLLAVGAVYYVVQATANDGDLLDLDNIELSQSSVVMATDPDTGAQVEYATLRSSNSPVSYTHLLLVFTLRPLGAAGRPLSERLIFFILEIGIAS